MAINCASSVFVICKRIGFTNRAGNHSIAASSGKPAGEKYAASS
jgi:hypothetical protein